MYKSPIEIFVKEMQMKQEEQVLKAVQEVGVSVDKDELIKALQYDRGQYEKGFAEGRIETIKEFAEKFRKTSTEVYDKHIFGNNDLEDEEKEAIMNFSDDLTYEFEGFVEQLQEDEK